ncbi:MAG: hypothetical protein A2Z29_11255 [Chloroflexi bacterium RBG_16_56_11]|nr:MAG: hypothetical protein A2Z29_11255 [Chloroflexi bacterium RBG_16_56_11]
MKKADYSKIAPLYDKGRSLSEENIDLWLKIISRLSGAREGARLLDLGCGTGRFAIPLATKLNYSVTGADSSKEMLAKAREKDANRLVKWDIEDAQSLSYPDKSFDLVFMSFLLQHCEDPARALLGCRRVLNDRGVILIRHAEIEQIQDDVVHTFFPETLAINVARPASAKRVESWLSEAGFSHIISEEIAQQTYTTGAARLEAVLLKGVSTLTMIPQEAFERGVKKLKQYIHKNPDDPWLLYDRITLTAGYKSKTA